MLGLLFSLAVVIWHLAVFCNDTFYFKETRLWAVRTEKGSVGLLVAHGLAWARVVRDTIQAR